MMDPTTTMHGSVGLKARLTRWQAESHARLREQRTDRLPAVRTESRETALAAKSKGRFPKGCKGRDCYGRGYIGTDTTGALISCPKCAY